MKLLVYCLIAALVGALVWGALLVYPLTSSVMGGPGGPLGTRWPEQLAALVLASVATALVFRPAIRRMERRWQVAFVGTLFVLAGSVAAGVLLVALPAGPGLFRGDEPLPVIVGGLCAAGILGLTIGVGFLPVGIPIGIGGTLALRRVAGRMPSA